MEGLKSRQKTALKNEISEYVVKKIQDTTQKKKSPVTGADFEKLSKPYKNFKKSSGKGSNANLFLDGLMLGDIETKNKSKGVEFKITDRLSKLKSMTHNKGEKLGGAKGVPRRPFMPDDSKKGKYGTFNKEIRDGISQIIKRFKSASKS